MGSHGIFLFGKHKEYNVKRLNNAGPSRNKVHGRGYALKALKMNYQLSVRNLLSLQALSLILTLL